MPLLQWKPEYSVNENELDSHHKRLFDILNLAYENIINTSEAYSITSVLNELSEYLKHHFSAEERLMGEKGYRFIDAHVAEHRHLSEVIESLRTNPHENSLDAAKELIVILGNWILHHILIEDKKYSDGAAMSQINSSGS